MKKILLLLMFIWLLTGCSKDSNLEKNVSTLPTGESFEFEKYDESEIFKIIYELEDGRKIISGFKKIVYQNYDKNIEKIELEEAFANNVITIDYLIEKMTLIDSDNNGDTKLYKSLADNVWLATCNNNKDIIIGTNQYIIEKCVN